MAAPGYPPALRTVASHQLGPPKNQRNDVRRGFAGFVGTFGSRRGSSPLPQPVPAEDLDSPAASLAPENADRAAGDAFADLQPLPHLATGQIHFTNSTSLSRQALEKNGSIGL